VPHPKLGSILMQNVIPRLSETPGRIDHAGPELGEHNEEIYLRELGLSRQELADLDEAGVV
jgi:formyl-CoA transferase